MRRIGEDGAGGARCCGVSAEGNKGNWVYDRRKVEAGEGAGSVERGRKE